MLYLAVDPETIRALIHLVKEDLGYHLHKAVQEVKCELSEHASAMFRFTDGVVDISEKVTRSSFERWISDELQQLESCIDSLLQNARVDRKDIDRVFLTGGSSFVPAVRRIFATRFGEQRIRAGHEFTSVARGLALKAATIPLVKTR